VDTSRPETPEGADDLTRRRFAQLGLVALTAAPAIRTIRFAGKQVGTNPMSTTTESVAPTTSTTSTTSAPTTTTVRQTTQGCSHGFWKNNTGAWVGYAPSTTLGSAFANVPPSLANNTFSEALNFQGNVGSEGRLLLQAVAALLNAAHPDVGYPLTEAEVKARVSNALAGSASDEEAVKDELDGFNNLACPLRADESTKN
jgi:hypothetical protein